MQRRQLLRQAAAMTVLSTGTLITHTAQAQSDSGNTKPISLIVGYSAGGSADLVARIVATELGKRLGRTVIIENVAGASGMLAAQRVLNGPADGSLIYMGGTDTVVVPMVNPKVKLDWENDFIPVGRMTTVPMIFAVRKASPYANLQDLVAALRKGGKDSINFATPGIGTMQHLYGALINKQAKVSMLHVPYRGGTHITNDLVGGQVDSAMLVLKLPASTEVRAESHLRDHLGLDSLTSMELLVSLEDEIEGFFVNPDTIAPGHFNTVTTLAQYIDANRQNAPETASQGQPEVQYEPV